MAVHFLTYPSCGTLFDHLVMNSGTSSVFYLFVCYTIFKCVSSLPNSKIIRDGYNDTKVMSLVVRNVAENASSEFSNSTPRAVPRRKWLTQIFLEAEATFDVDPAVTAACKRDFDLYKLHLQNQSVWAVRMLESSEWPSVGLFAGTIHHLGNYDECLLVSRFDFVGQYCMVQATYGFTLDESTEKNRFSWTSWPGEEYSAWGAVDTFSHDYARLSRQTINWALCIPSTCKIDDLKISLNRTLFPVFKNYSLDVKIDIDPIMCRVKGSPAFSTGFFVVGGIIIAIVTVEICATVYDWKKKGQEKRSLHSTNIFRSFSIFHNYKLWKTFSLETSFPIVHLTKIIAGALVLTGHRIMLYYFYPLYNAEIHEMKFKVLSPELLQTSVVDVFLCISGYMLYHYSFSSIQKGGIAYGFLYIVFRWMRMMVVPGAIILVVVNIAKYVSDGPMWNFYERKLVGYCESNWWPTIFAVNNIVKPDQPCLPQTWYLSVDFQLSILGVLLLYAMSKNKKLGIALTILVTIVSFIVVYIVINVQRFPGLPVFNINFLRNFTSEPQYYLLYVTSYTRIGSYSVGILTAIITEKLKAIDYKFSTRMTVSLFTSLLLFSNVLQLYGYVFYNPERPYNAIESGIFGCLHRTLFVLPYACLYCIYFTSGRDSFDKFFSWKWLVPVGRLVYCVYLTGPCLQLYSMISQRTYMNVSERIIAYWMSTGDVVWSFVIAFLIYLTLEGPTVNLQRRFQQVIFDRLQRTKK